MSLVEFPFAYLLWHYTTALHKIFQIWRNFVWYTVNLFSIPLLIRTLFAPWKRITDVFDHGSVQDYFEILVFNTLSRIFGFFFRVPVILVGLIATKLLFVGLVVFLIVWIMLPVILIGLVTYGFTFLYA